VGYEYCTRENVEHAIDDNDAQMWNKKYNIAILTKRMRESGICFFFGALAIIQGNISRRGWRPRRSTRWRRLLLRDFATLHPFSWSAIRRPSISTTTTLRGMRREVTIRSSAVPPATSRSTHSGMRMQGLQSVARNVWRKLGHRARGKMSWRRWR
jgi:hypothetical protein